MAAPIGVDRKLAGEVRRLALNKIKVILEKPVVEMNERDKDLHDQILLRLSGGILPRLNEITGGEGEPLVDMTKLAEGIKTIAEKVYDKSTNEESCGSGGDSGDEGLSEEPLQEPQGEPV